MMYLLLIIGFFLLVKGADYFVEGSSAVARLLKVPSVVIGLTIVAMGTSAPEAAVSITAGLAGSNELALSNVIGSNLFNLVLIVGICALIRPFIVDQSIMKRDFPVAILSSILLLFFIRDNFLSRIEGGDTPYFDGGLSYSDGHLRHPQSDRYGRGGKVSSDAHQPSLYSSWAGRHYCRRKPGCG